MKGGQRYALIGAAIVVAIVAFVVLRPGGEEPAGEGGNPSAQGGDRQESSGGGSGAGGGGEPAERAPEPIVVTVRNEKPVDGLEEIEVEKGEPVRLTVRSDSRQEIHVHGYDVHKDAAPGEPARFRFPADIEGVFEIELEEPGVQIAELKVEP